MKRTACLIVVLIATMPGLALAQVPVYFADANLKAVVEQELGISDPTPNDMLALTFLDASNRGIVYLTGLEYATNVTWLFLDYNQISEISALSGLTELEALGIDDNQISDISPLSGLTNLTMLWLGYNQISDISVLSGLTNLTWLNLDHNQISDISPLSGLTNLTMLWLGYNQISDIYPLSGLTNLTLLDLENNQISDISPLSGLTNLTMLWLGYNQISNIYPLSGLTNLTELGLYNNQISDISPLSGLTNLTGLYLWGNQISDSDISALAGLTNLTGLSLGANQISDISVLSGLMNLRLLGLGANQISDISPLAGLTNLTGLDLGANPLNEDAYNIYIPLILENNPGIILYYDPPTEEPIPKEAELAKQVIGADYLWGAKGWEGGRFLDASEIEDLDCSGLVFWSYNKAYGATEYQPCVKKDGMVEFPNPIAFEGANNQYHYNVEAIAKEDLLPGDLLFFDADKRTPKGEWIEYGQDGRVDHVAMYVGTFQYEGEEYNVVEATPPWVKSARVDEVIARIRNLSGQDAFKGFGRVISVTMPLEEALTIPGLIIKDNCPVDLIVTDPEGFEVTTDIREVPDMIYLEVDTDGDSELEDVVLALKRKVGDYSIIVVPELGASPTDTYSLEFIANGDTIILVEDVAIKDIPAQPYIIRSTEDEITPIISATIDFDPDTLNLKSEGGWVTVYIELPVGHGYDAGEIDVGGILLEGLLEVEHSDVQGDVLMVKVDRQDVIAYIELVLEIELPADVTLMVTGELTDGTPFEGIDTIRVIDEGGEE